MSSTAQWKSLQRPSKELEEEQPDQYLAPHPLMGRITLRELCYFTIYHVSPQREYYPDVNGIIFTG